MVSVSLPFLRGGYELMNTMVPTRVSEVPNRLRVPNLSNDPWPSGKPRPLLGRERKFKNGQSKEALLSGWDGLGSVFRKLAQSLDQP